MDIQRALPFLLLLICTINASFCIHNGRSGSNNIRRVRRISEYLVPPPPPKFQPPSRIPRLAKPGNEPGYFTRLMSWLNPFGSSQPSPPPPPPPPHLKTPYPPQIHLDALPAATTYNGPPPIDYEKPPLPAFPVNDHSAGYLPPPTTKNCNPCNKVPWTPMQQELPHPTEASYAPPPLLVDSQFNGGYPPRVPQDVYHAASQEVRIPDFSYSTPVNPLPNPHLYPGAMPPLFKAEYFNPPPAIPDDPGLPDHSGAGIVSYQEPGFINLDANNGELEHFPKNHADNDLFSSGTQVSHGHTNFVPDKPGFEGGEGSIANHQFLNVFNNGEFYDTTGLNGSSQSIPPDLPSYGISDLDRLPNNYNYKHNDQSSSGNVIEGSRVPSHTSDRSKIEESINFEESPLLDFTHKGESRTHSSSIPPTSNAFVDYENTEILRTTAVPNDEIFRTQQDDLLNDNVNSDVTAEHQGGKRNKQVQVIIPYTSEYTPLPFHPSHEKKISDTGESNHDSYVGEESVNRPKVIKAPPLSLRDLLSKGMPISEDAFRKILMSNNSIDIHKLQKNIDNWTIQKYSTSTTATTVRPSNLSSPYLSSSKTIPKEYFTSTEPITPMDDSYINNIKTFTLAGFSFNDEEYKGSASHRVEGARVQVIKIENSTKSSIDARNVSEKDMWRSFPVGISSVNKERVYIVTPEPHSVPSLNPEYRKQKALKEASNDTKESKRTPQTDIKKAKKSGTFESIEKAYQVLPQAVNNLAVASTGPESVSLWGIMEHDEFASSVDSEYDNNDTEPPTLHSKFSKESRARR
ncbi:hypothetical protein PUN28_006922 [Cardiocondyla obscurior]|uniref:Uncharacterized protein n=1 Tax=Cardiocondyla obscurior TaxID=286306 RepID=A0AAW2G5S0_9HYME